MFENILEICVLNSLFDFLASPHYNFYCKDNYLCDDLFKLIRCNKKLNFLVTCNLLKHIEYPLSLIFQWNKRKLETYRTHIRKIFADTSLNENDTFGQLFPNLKHMTVYHNYNTSIFKNVLPNSLTNLTFVDKFVDPFVINELPKTLKNLTFGFNFNHSDNEV